MKILAWLIAALLVLWVVLWAIVQLNQRKLIGRLSDAIREKTGGEVVIGGASVSFIRTFPILSLELTQVVIRDSLYASHHQDFFRAESVYLRVSLRDLMKGRSAVSRVTVRNGSMYVFTDSTGRSNEYILRGEQKPESQPRSSIPIIILNNVDMHYNNDRKRKLFEGKIRVLKCVVEPGKEFMIMNVSLDAHLNRFVLNRRRGSYIKNSDLAGAFQLTYNLAQHDLLINHVGLNINDHPFYFDGYFRIDPAASDFTLTISTANIPFHQAAALLNDTLEKRLAAYAFSEPVSPEVTVSGQTISRYGPDVRIRMKVDMGSVDRIAGISSLQYSNGFSDVDITIVSSQGAKDTVNGDLNGTIRVHNTHIRYLPRDFTLRDCNGVVHFDSNDILVDSLSAVAGATKLVLDGKTKNLITLGSADPGRLTMQWKLVSPDLHLKDFRNFLSKGHFRSGGSALDKLFSTGDFIVSVSAGKMDYNHFHATQVAGDVVLKQSGIQVSKLAMNHASGHLQVSGELQNGVRNNPIAVRAKMEKVDVPQLFTAFNNFGQDAVTAANLKGRLSADVTFSSSISNQGELRSEDGRGIVDFVLENGELDNFEPLMQASGKAFKKQDFSKIRFADLRNKLQISGTTFIVNPMEIRSTAFTLFVEGVYDIRKGSDMSIRFPLRNITKNQAKTDLSDEAKTKKGIGLRLRAKTGSDGKLKISWDPFRRSIKNRDQAVDSLETAIH